MDIAMTEWFVYNHTIINVEEKGKKNAVPDWRNTGICAVRYL